MRVARNASGFDQPEIAKVLDSCDVILTSNIEMAPVLDRLFTARVFVVRQDCPDDVVRTLLTAMHLLPEGEPLEVVSVLPLFKDYLRSPRDSVVAAGRTYFEAVDALVAAFRAKGNQ